MLQSTSSGQQKEKHDVEFYRFDLKLLEHGCFVIGALFLYFVEVRNPYTRSESTSEDIQRSREREKSQAEE